jgi:hypothetical protein
MWRYVIMQHGAARWIEKYFGAWRRSRDVCQVHSLHGKKRPKVVACGTERVSSFRISNVISQKADETITWLRYRHRTP